MPEDKNNSSLPLLLGITSVVVVCVGGGWFLLDARDAAQPATAEIAFAEPGAEKKESASQDVVTVTDLDMDLRKARMAAQSDLLALPGEQSALYFYSRVLTVQPEHATARAEFDEVLDRIGQQVSRQLQARNFTDAYGFAKSVAELQPDHPLVRQTQSTLDSYASDLSDQALQAAREGKDDEADQALASVAELPGLDAGYVRTLRASITDIRQARRDVQDRERRRTDAAAKARHDWLATFNGAIAAGRLIAPAGDNAREYLAGNGAPSELKAGLTGELVAALVSTAHDQLDAGQLEQAETLLRATIELGGDSDTLDALSDALHAAYVRREQNRLRPIQELVRLKNVPARYPSRAEERGMSGWVELTFTVTPSGQTTAIEVLQAEPEDVFDESAIEAASQWLFKPLEFRGEVISQRATARLVFRLE